MVFKVGIKVTRELLAILRKTVVTSNQVSFSNKILINQALKQHYLQLKQEIFQQ